MKFKILAGVFSVFIACLVSNPAFALTISDITSFDTSNDLSIILLKTMFGGMPIFGGGEDPIRNIMMVFNALVLTTGSVLLGYNLLIGTMATAQHGEMLGKYSTQMTPLRMAYASFLLIPIANGYSLIQMIIMWLIVYGAKFASILWHMFVSSDNLATALSVSPIRPEAKELARNVLLASTCMAAIQKQAQLDGDENNVQMAWSYGYGDARKVWKLDDLPKLVADNPEDEIVLNAGNVNGTNGITDNACGTLVIPSFTEERDGYHQGQDKTKMATEMGTIVLGGTAAWRSESTTVKAVSGVTALYSAFRLLIDYKNDRAKWLTWLNTLSIEHASSTEVLMANAKKAADAIVSKVAKQEIEREEEVMKRLQEINSAQNIHAINMGHDNLAAKKAISQDLLPDDQILQLIDGLASTYQTQFRAKAAKTYNGGEVYDNLVRNANDFGWLMAGSFYTQMSSMTDSINKIALELPKSEFKITPPPGMQNDKYNTKYMAALNYYLSESKAFKNDNIRLQTRVHIENGGHWDSKRFLDSGFNLSLVFDSLLSSSMNNMISDQEHPMLQIKRLGSLMITSATMLIAHMTTNLQNTEGGISFFISIFGWTLIASLLMGGITMNFILPMMPTFIWVGMVLGWLVLVFQAMIASSFWIMMHIAPHSGDDFIGGQKQGYMLTFTLVARPVLMVFGYIASVIILTVVGYVVNTLFVFIYGFSNVESSGLITAVVGLLVVPLIYCAFVWNMIKEVMNLMYRLPDELLSWMGGGSQLGSYAQSMSHGSVAAFGMINQQATQPFGLLRNNLQTAAEQNKSRKADAQAREKAHWDRMDNIIAGGGGGVANGGVNADTFEPFNDLSAAVKEGEEPLKFDSWTGAIQGGMFKDDPMDLFRARQSLASFPSDLQPEIVKGALEKSQEQFALNGNQPLDNSVFANAYNKRGWEMVYGDKQAVLENIGQVMERHPKLKNVAYGESGKDGLANSIMKKARALRESGYGTTDSNAREIVQNLNDSMQALSAYHAMESVRRGNRNLSDPMLMSQFPAESYKGAERDFERHTVGAFYNQMQQMMQDKNAIGLTVDPLSGKVSHVGLNENGEYPNAVAGSPDVISQLASHEYTERQKSFDSFMNNYNAAASPPPEPVPEPVQTPPQSSGLSSREAEKVAQETFIRPHERAHAHEFFANLSGNKNID